MGLTINYKIKVEGTKQQIADRLIEIRSACLDKPFEEVSEVRSIIITKKMIDVYQFWQDYCFFPNNSVKNLAKRNQELLDLGVDIGLIVNLDVHGKLTPKRQIISLNLWPGKGCETFNINLIKNKTNNVWHCDNYCKTQYAEHFIRYHLLVINVLDMLKEKGFEIKVNDEGEYWTTRDLKILAKNINEYTGILVSIEKALKESIKDTEMSVKCEIENSKNIIQIN